MVVSDGAAASPSMYWKICDDVSTELTPLLSLGNRTEVLLDLPRGRVESIRGTNLQKQDQNTTTMLNDDKRTRYHRSIQIYANGQAIQLELEGMLGWPKCFLS